MKYTAKKPPFWAYVVFILCLIIFVLSGCKTIEYVPKIETRVEYRDRIEKDTISVHDSVYVYQKQDTIFSVKYREIYREKVRIDTAFLCNTDTIIITKEIEKKLTRWQQAKMDLGGGAMGLLIILILAGCTYLAYKFWKR